jgi:hypothetical protein
MILEKQKEANVLQTQQSSESVKMSLDLESAQVLMQMLSKNLYADAIGSTVRECASNALDSHRRAGVNKPIVVSLGRNNQNNYEFSVEDFGIGLDDVDVKNIISKYGKSTKRDSNTELGMMGLGFKAPLAYSSSFYFRARKDGMERNYMMYEGEDVNTIDLLSSSPTSEPNGVKITIPVKWVDKNDFRSKIKEQLAYFQSVYFDVEDIDNNFLIHRSKIFQFSELANDMHLHVCLDDVYYPLDFQKLGIDEIRMPVGLRFSLTDGLFPTPNRESLRYTKEAKGVILKKIEELANYVVSKYNESIEEKDNLFDVMRYYKDKERTVDIVGHKFDANRLQKFSTIAFAKPTVDKVKLIDLSRFCDSGADEYLLSEYKIFYKLSNDRMQTFKEDDVWRNSIPWKDFYESKYMLIKETPRGNKKSYLRHICKDRTKFIKKRNSHVLGSRLSTGYKNYYQILDLKNHPKGEWRERIKEFQWMINEFISSLSVVDDIEIDQQWLDDKNAAVAAKRKLTISTTGPKLQGEIPCKIADSLLRYVDGQNCKFVADKINVDTLTGGPLHIYAKHDEASLLDAIYEIGTYNNFKLITVSNREFEGLESLDVPELTNYRTFITAGSLKFKQIVTASLIYKLQKEYSESFSNASYLEVVNKTLADQLSQLSNYKTSHYPSRPNDSTNSITKEWIDYATNKCLFDPAIYGTYLTVSNVLEKHYYIELFCSRLHWNNKKKFHRAFYDMMTHHGLLGRIKPEEKVDNE